MSRTLFFALFPSDVERARTAHAARALIAALGLRGKPVDAAKLHATVHFIGRIDGTERSVIDTAIAAAARLRGAAFELVFDRALSFAGGRGAAPFVLAASRTPEAFRALHDALRNVHAGAAHTHAELVAHATVLHSADRLGEIMPVEPIAWKADRLVLAMGGAAGAGYECVAEWPLG